MQDPRLNYLLWRVARMTDDEFREAAERFDNAAERILLMLRVACGRVRRMLSHDQSGVVESWLRRSREFWMQSIDRLDEYVAGRTRGIE